MFRFQFIVNWVDWTDNTRWDRRLIFMNAKTEEAARATFIEENGDRHVIVAVKNRGIAKK